MKIVRFPLKPLSHFRFGEIALDNKSNLATTSAVAHSDTLFSSLINNYSQFQSKSETDAFVGDFLSGLTKVSSMNYYIKTSQSTVYFLPLPLSYKTQSLNHDYFKALKKIEYISTGAWESITNVEDFFNLSICVIIQGKFVLLKKELANIDYTQIEIFNKLTQPKIPIRDSSPEATIYFETDIEIADNKNIGSELTIGFYFLYESTAETRLKNATNYLGLNGIGGGRSTGSGVLSAPEFDDVADFDFASLKSTSFCNISLIIPNDNSEFEQIDIYEVAVRGGRNMDYGKQKFVRMLYEGAIIKSKIEGQIVKTGIDENGNSIYRYGKAFLLPVTSIDN
jgi:CRISPR type III-A-associated RAMP protein Csm4